MQPITRVNPGVISPNRRNKSTVPNLPDRTRSANSLFIESEINLSSAQYLCFHLSGVGERQCGSKLTVSRKLFAYNSDIICYDTLLVNTASNQRRLVVYNSSFIADQVSRTGKQRVSLTGLFSEEQSYIKGRSPEVGIVPLSQRGGRER